MQDTRSRPAVATGARGWQHGDPPTLKVSEAFTKLPGPRYRRQGPGSGEELREAYLEPLYEQARGEGCNLIVDLDGSEFGYAIGFIEEAFGGLARKHGAAEVLESLEIRCSDIPEARADAIDCIEAMQTAETGDAEDRRTG